MDKPYDDEKIWRLAAGPQAAASVFSYLRDGLQTDIGCGLMTASVYDLRQMRSRRVFSENQTAYPVGNFKRLDKNLYFEEVIVKKQHFSSTTIEEIAVVFFDWEKIRDLGFESNLNIPAIADDQVIGSVNLLAKKGHYTRAVVEKALRWRPVVTLAFLLLNTQGQEFATFDPSADVKFKAETEGG
ncbi:hypothetical protein [Agrobacterium rubi]|uniref:GAF domain-containing protein n=1 Tax=Agrobacterium rubi TaxID=28099 RepID=A0AAE7R906_9HYPH|nr:hypothetical protein [Agrobacterium rubi]NTE88063.1 hypothetical protein [Agrobacterium rubi]NTF03830.1 hypothetical protein [Agrobacterium rubi]NTF38157.1 hypothetical protein [Agrobacterium rubi]OCJ43665.1 hypothetical protein A6U92_19490 [Agrobacterium rubi]QTG01937.1 hypothetical protein G6M88_15860 [Agrobacterium rubi]